MPLFNAVVLSLQGLKEVRGIFSFEIGGRRLRYSEPLMLGHRVTQRASLQSLGLCTSTSFNLPKLPLTASDGDQRMLGGLPISTRRLGPSDSHCFVLGLFPGWLLSIHSMTNTLGSKEPGRAPVLKKLTVYLGDRQSNNFSKRTKWESLRKDARCFSFVPRLSPRCQAHALR